MSDYISKESVIKLLCELHVDNIAVNGKRLTELIKELPTLDEKEIIRKPFERVVKKIDDLDRHFDNGDFAICKDALVVYKDVIEIIKEECGINERD